MKNITRTSFNSSAGEPLITFVVVVSRLDAFFLIHFRFFLAQLQLSYREYDYDLLILAGEPGLLTEVSSVPRTRVIVASQHPWDRLSGISRNTVFTPLVALMTADDLWRVDRGDLISFATSGAKVGAGNCLGVRPVNDRLMRIFQAWTQFSEYMRMPPSELRFRTYISEAPDVGPFFEPLKTRVRCLGAVS